MASAFSLLLGIAFFYGGSAGTSVLAATPTTSANSSSNGAGDAKAKPEAKPQPPKKPLPASVRFELAREAYRNFQYRKALVLVAEIERDTPGQVRFGNREDGSDADNLYNFKGSCLTALRYFQHARREFEKALATQPESFDMKYNLAEMDFLQEHFAEARAKFADLLESTDQGRLYSEFLIFKMAMCSLMEGEKDKALESLDLHGRDTPIHIFLNTAIAFQEKEADRAEVLLTLAREKVGAGDYALYEDSLIECGLLDPPELPKLERRELDAAMRKPISLGTDRVYPSATPVDGAADAASLEKSGG